MGLTEVQQHLLSFFKTVHASSAKDAHEFYGRLSDKESFSNNIAEEISTINQVIKAYDLEIVPFVDELTCEKLFILINTVRDEITQKAKFYDKNSTLFFSEIVKACVASENGSITETHCLNLNSQVGLTKTASQSIIDIFVRDKWLICQNGSISLGMRSIAELQQSIRQLYSDDAKYCPLCKHFVMQGFICNNCNARYHLACLRKFISHKSTICCTDCKENFQDLPLQVTQVEENDISCSQTSIPTASQYVKRKRVM